MTNSTIRESGMIFPYPEGHCFCIDKSATYKKLQNGVKMADLLLLRTKNGAPPIVWVVEAKSSAPNPDNGLDFNEFMGEIREKLANGLSLGLAVCLKRHQTTYAEIPEPFKKLDLSTASFQFILVINGHKDKWLPQLQESLVKELNATAKIWALPPQAVIVLNDSTARERGLIQAASE